MNLKVLKKCYKIELRKEARRSDRKDKKGLFRLLHLNFNFLENVMIVKGDEIEHVEDNGNQFKVDNVLYQILKMHGE